MVPVPRSSPTGDLATHNLPDPLPIGTGSRGDSVTDLRERLGSLRISTDGDARGFFGEATARAVKEFQQARGLRADGTCDRDTWAALVEAGYRLGDRLLYRRTPMLRGDDVADLQRRLSAFGFYADGIDAIYGDRTAAALADFQRNIGLPADGMLGPRTLVELARLSSHVSGGDLVSSVRERLLRGGLSALKGAKVAVGENGGFAPGVAAACRALGNAGAVTLDLHHPDSSRLAAEANVAEAAVYVGLQLDPTSGACQTAYYSGYRYESLASKGLAQLIQAELPGLLGLADGGVVGMAIPILRETRMPAVLLELGDPARVIQHTTDLARLLVRSLTSWMSSTWG